MRLFWHVVFILEAFPSLSLKLMLLCRFIETFVAAVFWLAFYFYTQATFHEPFFLLLFEFWPNNNNNTTD